MEDTASSSEPRQKRQKTSQGKRGASALETETSMPIDGEPSLVSRSVNQLDDSVENTREAAIGVRGFVGSRSSGFSGTLKKRYTDFLVNEILPNGQVLHLRSLEAGRGKLDSIKGNEDHNSSSFHVEAEQPVEEGASFTKADTPSTKPQKPQQNASATEQSITISEADRNILESYLEEETTLKLLDLFHNIVTSKQPQKDAGTVVSAVTPERSARTALHAEIRRIFSSRVDSFTDKDGVMKFGPAKNSKSNRQGAQNRRAKLDWDEKGGEHLHFSIYKENRDTMEVIGHLCRQLKMNAKSFQFAGTKDKRAVTIQRASVFRIDANHLASQNKGLRSSAVGDFQYQRQGLQLGDLQGNEFHLTLRDCCFVGDNERSVTERVENARHAMSLAIQDLHQMGFFNFYGLQRFGTFSTTTDTVGLNILRGDFQGAVEAILHYEPESLFGANESQPGTKVGSDDRARAEAILLFKTTNKASAALEKLPRKFSAESTIIRHLSKQKNDYAGALAMIPRNLKLMYVHAYQSLVWNFAVGERWKLYGDKVVEGDLVMVNEHKDKVSKTSTADDVIIDADGEAILLPADEDSAKMADDVFERARALTAEEAASGRYSIFDIVLPLPGYDIVYPPNGMTEFYKSFMASERGGGLDPFDMRRKQRDFSLSGSYRKVVARIGGDFEVDVRAYEEEDEQFVQTDLEMVKIKSGDLNASKAMEGNAEGEEQQGSRLAVILKFQLGSSTYATMALRELSKGGIAAWKPDFSGGR